MSEESTNIEERAIGMGWAPKEEFRGKPENWRTAEEFVSMAENSLPHLKGTLNVLERSNAELKATIESMKGDFTQFVQFSKQAEERAYERAVKDLETKQREAKDAGDLPAYVEATEDLQKKLQEHPAITGKTPVTQTGGGDPVQQWRDAEPGLEEKWKNENTQIFSDPELYTYAEQMDRFLHARDGLTKPRSYRLSEITRMVKERFPEKFGNPKRTAAPAVESDSGGGPSGGNGRSYNDLPADAKALCDKWAGKDGKGKTGTIPDFTREDYLKSYKWDKQYPSDNI